MRLAVYITFIFMLMPMDAEARQISQLSLFNRNQSYYNPAANGFQEVLTANFFYRQNWVGFPGTPSTQVFSVHAPLRKPVVAMGLLLEHEAIGVNNYTGIHVSYAYRLRLGTGKLSLGMRAGLTNGSQNPINYRDDAFDPALELENLRFMVPNFGFGAFFYNRQYWVGLSAPRLLTYQSNGSGSYRMSFSLAAMDYLLIAGADIKLSADFGIEPSLLAAYSSGYGPRFQINAMGVYKEAYRAGLAYRYHEAVVILMVYKLNRQFSLGYSYDLNIGRISDYSSGSHEINLQYRFGYKVNASDPRNF